MKIYRNLDKSHFYKDSIVTVGTFDGVHLGHREVIATLNNLKYENSRTVVVAFDPHPQLILQNKNTEIKLLSTIDEKIKTFEKLGIDVLYILEFTKEFAMTSAEDFLNEYLVCGTGLKHLVLGYDHSFGKNREGNFETLSKLTKKYDFELHKVSEFSLGSKISSTAIRNFLLSGEVEKAAELLGDDYSFSGLVVSGDRRGNTIGFPTANVFVNDVHKLIPKNGVYFVEVEIANKKYSGMMNIGKRPTVSNSEDIFIEVNIFDFNKDIYGEDIKVILKHYIRDEKKFGSLDELVKQLNTDKENCLNFLNK